MLPSGALRTRAISGFLLKQELSRSVSFGAGTTCSLFNHSSQRAPDGARQQGLSGTFMRRLTLLDSARRNAVGFAQNVRGQNHHHRAVLISPTPAEVSASQRCLRPASLLISGVVERLTSVVRSGHRQQDLPNAARLFSSISSVSVAPTEPNRPISVTQAGNAEAISEGNEGAELASDGVSKAGGLQSDRVAQEQKEETAAFRQPAEKRGKKFKSSKTQRTAPGATHVDYTNIRGITFEACMPKVRAALREADFVAFDLEYTGILSAPWQWPGEFDTKDTIYAKRKQSAEKFTVLQVGLCPFKWEADTGRFKVSPFKFLIYPLVRKGSSFLCDTGSLKFLSVNKIDVADSVSSGIPYLSEPEERAFMEKHFHRKLLEGVPFQDLEYSDLTPKETSSVEKRVQHAVEWHGSMKAKGEEDTDAPKKLRLRHLTLLQRRVIVEAVRRICPMLLPVTANDAKKRSWELGAGTEQGEPRTLEIWYAGSAEEKNAMEAQVRARIEEQAREALDKSVGFKKVVDELAQSPTFLVGHNCLQDLMHMQDKFGPGLAPTLSAFCNELRAKFPVIFDTKHVIFSDDVADDWDGKTDLRASFRRTNKYDVPVSKADGFDPHPELPTPAQRVGNALRDGGMDAFMAGLLFARLAKRRGIPPGQLRSLPDLVRRRSDSQQLENMSETTTTGGSVEGQEKVEPLQELAAEANWLYAGTMINAHASLSLLRQGFVRACRAEDDPRHRHKWGAQRPDVLLFWGFPNTLSDAQLRAAIVSQQGQKGHKLVRLDDEAALVRFPSHQHANEFWEGALKPQGRTACGRTITLGVGSKQPLEIKVETFETYMRVCQSGITAPSFTQAATWLGLNPLKTVQRQEQAALPMPEVDKATLTATKKLVSTRNDSKNSRGEQTISQPKRVYGVVSKTPS